MFPIKLILKAIYFLSMLCKMFLLLFCKYSHQPFIFSSEIFIEMYMNLEESKFGKGRFAQ